MRLTQYERTIDISAQWRQLVVNHRARRGVPIAFWAVRGSGRRLGESTLGKVKKTGRLKAAYTLYPPFVERRDDELTGYFVELTDTIAKEAGFEVDYEETTWASAVVALQTHKADIVVAGIFRTLLRAREVTFSDPVLFVGMSAITRRHDNGIQTVDDLKKPGLTSAFVNGGVSHEYVKKYLPNAKTIVLPGSDFARPMLEVIANRADVALSDSISCFSNPPPAPVTTTMNCSA